MRTASKLWSVVLVALVLPNLLFAQSPSNPLAGSWTGEWASGEEGLYVITPTGPGEYEFSFSTLCCVIEGEMYLMEATARVVRTENGLRLVFVYVYAWWDPATGDTGEFEVTSDDPDSAEHVDQFGNGTGNTFERL